MMKMRTKKVKNPIYSTMKKYILLSIFSLFIFSCSKKEIIISGKISNGSPLSRIEIVDMSSVATLPIINIGLDEKGNFSDTLSVEKSGVYAVLYNGRNNFIYLKKGENINISGNSATFPEEMKFTGEGQGNNNFLIESQKFISSYFSKLNSNVLEKNESEFIKELDKYQTDIDKKIDEIAEEKKADKETVEWKKKDLMVNLLIITSQYEMMHGQMIQNPDFKVSAKFREAQKKFEKESFIKEFPAYRQYLLSKLQADFSKFAMSYINDTKTTRTEIFLKFLETRKEFSQEQKDYLVAFITTHFDLHPQNEKMEQVMKAINEKIKTEPIKKDLEKVYNTISGIKVGSPAPDASLLKQDGKTGKLSELKGKPTLLVFYSSWAPNMVENIAPTIKEISEFYQSKMNFAYINFDDDAKQFQKTSKALFNGFTGTNFYAKGGLKSDAAQQFLVYGFKLPSFVVLDKEGKIASKVFFNIADTNLIEILNKQTGLTAPVPEASEIEEEHNEHDGHGH